MWISDYWYEKLPWLYSAASLLSLLLLGSLAAFSALVLLSAAALTAWWRYEHRQLGGRG